MTELKSRVHFENLDGFRFLAFQSVFLFHSGHTEYDFVKEDALYKAIKQGVFSYGHLGVNFFFVLSGFLITYLLLEEEVNTTRINIGRFYMRRVLRIWPLFYFCVLFGFVIFPLVKSFMGQTPQETANIWYFIPFLSNFNTIENGLPDASVLGVLWSVSIEEQFYLFWPLLIVLFRTKKLFAFLLVIVVSVVFRYFNVQNGSVLYHHTLSVISDMAVGGLVAWLCFSISSFKQWLIDLKKETIAVAYLFGIVLLILSPTLSQHNGFLVIERLLLSLFFVFIIAEQCFSENSFYKMGKNKFLSTWGKYTYGLYCLHFIGILITTNAFKLLKLNDSVWFVLVVETLVALTLSMIIAWVSYHAFEKHFLKLKSKFDYSVKKVTGAQISSAIVK